MLFVMILVAFHKIIILFVNHVRKDDSLEKMKMNKVIILSKLRSTFLQLFFRKRTRNEGPEDIEEKVLWKNRVFL